MKKTQKQIQKQTLADSSLRLPCRGCTRRCKNITDVTVNPGGSSIPPLACNQKDKI